MSDFYNEDLRKLAKRSNAEMMTPVDAFAQGFIMGRKYEQEHNADLHNRILREMRNAEPDFSGDNYWDTKIKEQDEELFELRRKYVWPEED